MGFCNASWWYIFQHVVLLNNSICSTMFPFFGKNESVANRTISMFNKIHYQTNWICWKYDLFGYNTENIFIYNMFKDRIIKATFYTIFVNQLFHILSASVSCLLHFTWPYQFHPCTFPPKAKWKVNKIWREQIYVLYNKYVMLFIEIQNVCCEFAVWFYLLDHISFSPLHYTPEQNKTIKKLHRWQRLLLLI